MGLWLSTRLARHCGFGQEWGYWADAMDILDVLLIALVLGIAVHLLSDGGWGGGKRSRNLTLCPATFPA